MIRQVSSTLLSPTEKLRIQLSVGLIDSSNNPSYCSIYNGGNGSYLNITPMPQIVIKYVDKSHRWNRADNIYINQRNIFSFREETKLFYRKMMDHADDIYKYGQSGYIVAMGNTEEYRKIINMGQYQILTLEPISVYGSNGRPIPGVSMEINQRSNLVELSIEEFEAVYDLLQTIQLHQEGMLLLQSYMMICLKSGGLKIPLENDGSRGGYISSSKDVKVNIFESAQKRNLEKEQEESVVGPNITKQPTTLEELG